MTTFLLALALLAPKPAVTLQVAAPDAKSVTIAGDLYGWGSPKPLSKEGSTWSIRLDVPDDARFEYKFIVDGNWINDPNAGTIDNSIGGINSVYEGPNYKPTTNEGEPKSPLVRSTITMGSREVIVFSPKDSKGLPILAYGDGQNYEKYGKVQNVLQNLVEAGKARPAVIVLIPPVDRMREYGNDWKVYGHFLLDQVLPEVRKRTGASTRSEDVFIGGSSMGGLISLRLAEEFPDKVAGGVHSQSGAFVRSQSLGDFKSVITQSSFGKLAPTTRLWLCWGTFEQELTAGNEEAVRTLDTMRRPYAKRVTNEGHNWTAWRNRMEEALIYLLPPK